MATAMTGHVSGTARAHEGAHPELCWPVAVKGHEATVLAHLIASGAHGTVSQASLHWNTGISQSTISRTLESLLSQRLIEKADTRQGSRGHPTTRWRVSDRFFVLGINLRDDFGSPGRLQGVATTLDGRRLAHESRNLHPSPRVDQVVDALSDLATHLAEKVMDHGESTRLLGVGVSLGGHVHEGEVVCSHNLGWLEGVPLQQLLHDALSSHSNRQIVTIVENNVNSFAARYNPRGGPQQWRVVTVIDHRGIGCGLFLNGELYRGDDGKAGEFGHVPVTLDLASRGCRCGEAGPYNPKCPFTCRCGSHGCLETASTPQAIQRALGAGSLDEAAQRLRAGDSTAAAAFDFAGKAFGYALANLVVTLDPRHLRLLGHSLLVDRNTLSGKAFVTAMETVLDRHSFSRSTCLIETEPHDTAEAMQDEAAFAVASDVVQRFLSDRI